MIRKISIIQEQEIIEKYLNGYETKILAKEYNCDVSTITNYLKKNNISARGNCGNLTIQIELEIIDRLKNFEKARDLVKLFKINYRVIKKVAKKYNFEIRKIKYSFDENYFENINTKDKAYFLGLLYADGGISHNRMSITLQKQDDYILNIFFKKLNCVGNIGFRHSKNEGFENEYTTFGVSSKKIISDLKIIGCGESKSFKIRFPHNLDNKLFWSFLRGVFDGDGNFYYQKSRNKTNWSIISNLSFCQDLQAQLLKRGMISNIYQNKNKHKDIAEIRVFAHADIKKIFHYMYENCDNLYLTRKYDKFIEFLEYNYNCRYNLEPVKQKYIRKQAA
jgi:hypothetical protein